MKLKYVLSGNAFNNVAKNVYAQYLQWFYGKRYNEWQVDVVINPEYFLGECNIPAVHLT